MATYADLITRSLLELGVVEGGETPETHLITEGIKVLQEMLNSWALEGLLTPGVSTYEHTFTSETATKQVTIGPAPDDPSTETPPVIEADTVPTEVVHVQYRPGGIGNGYALRAVSANVYLDTQEYYEDSTESPRTYWYEPDTPYGFLFFESKPNVNDSITIHSEKMLVPQNITSEDEASFLPGYQRAIRLNLAVELASSHGVKGGQLSPITVQLAMRAKRDIRILNFQRHGQTKFDLGALQNSRRGFYGHHAYDRFNPY